MCGEALYIAAIWNLLSWVLRIELAQERSGKITTLEERIATLIRIALIIERKAKARIAWSKIKNFLVKRNDKQLSELPAKSN